MSYNPYASAFRALTCPEAREFYSNTAQAHASGVLDACKGTIAAGRQFRQFHDAAIVPFTLLAIATVVQFFATPAPVLVEPVQPVLAGFTPAGLLPPAKPVERVLVTPSVTSDRVIITPINVDGFSHEAVVQLHEEFCPVEAPVEAAPKKTRRGTRGGRKAKATA